MSVGFFSFIWNTLWSCVLSIFKAIWWVITLGWELLVFLCKLPFKIIGWCWSVIKFLFSLLGDLWDVCCWLVAQLGQLLCVVCSLVWDGIKTVGKMFENLIIALPDLSMQLGGFLWQYKWWVVGVLFVLYICVHFARNQTEEERPKQSVQTKPKDWQTKKMARLRKSMKQNAGADETKFSQIIQTLPPQSKKRQFIFLYKNIIDEMERLVKDLKAEIVNISNDAHFEQALAGVKQIMDWRALLVENVRKLAAYADWDIFTFAFYGETNAGKSTLIESLRLLLQESTKLQEQKKCAAYVHAVASLANQVGQAENRLVVLDSDRALQQQQFTVLSAQQQQAESSFQQQQQVLQEAIASYKTQMTLWKPVTYFKKRKDVNNKKMEWKNLWQKYNENQSNFRKRQQAFEKNIKDLDRQQIALRSQLEELKEKLAKISQEWSSCQDGSIIGDGSPDYTRETTAYQFCVGGTTFRLLDLPGIEGREEKVKEVILNSLHQAHVVFYISSKNTPPQKGDAEGEGTLGKIKSHLSDQAEVYSIWNKSINTVSSLRVPLEDPNSLPALEDTKKCLTQQLSGHYKGHFTLSAQPAFLGLAKYIQRDITKHKQTKFLKEMKPEELVCKSNMQAFADFLVSLSDVAKIEKANVHKVSCVLQDTAKIVKMCRKSTREMYDAAVGEVEKASKEIKTETNNLVAFIRRQCGGATEAIINDTRKNCYARIDLGISSEDMEAMFKQQFTNNLKRVLNHIQEKIGNHYAEYEKHLNDILKRLHDHLDFCCNRINKKLQVSAAGQSVNVSNPWTKGNIIGAVGSAVGIVGGIATLASGTVKGAALAGAIGAIIGGILGLIVIGVNVFRKKARQKEAIDKVLNKIEEVLREQIKEKLENYIQTVTQQAATVEGDIQEIPVPFLMQQNRLEKFISFLRVQADILNRREYANK